MPRLKPGQARKTRKHRAAWGSYAPTEEVLANDPDSIWAYHLRFSRWQEERNYARATIIGRERALCSFAIWAADRGVVRPHDVTKPILERWQRYLFLYRKLNGQPLGVRSQRSLIEPLIAYFKWLARENYILYNPASDLVLPRIGKRLPSNLLTASEAERVMASANVGTRHGIRDRAILETLYSTGVRRKELIALKLHDLDPERGVIMVREGKGDKDRMIPIGERALAWVDKYLADVRPDHASGADDGTLFLSIMGTPFKPSRLAEIARRAIDKARIGKRGACHLFRHTMATLMLENGADIRFIQAILGHSRLTSTEIYTQVSIKQLKAVHTATHPAQPIGKADRTTPTNPETEIEAQALFDALDREAAEEEAEIA